MHHVSLQIANFSFINDNVSSVYSTISQFTDNFFIIWTVTARICWIIAKRASYLTEMFVLKLTTSASIDGSAGQSLDQLNSLQKQELFEALLTHGSSLECIANEFKEKLDLLSLQAEASEPDPILSYHPESDQSGARFQPTAHGVLKLLTDSLPPILKVLKEAEAEQVAQKVQRARELLNTIERIEKEGLPLFDK